MKLDPETKKIAIYGSVLIGAGIAVFYFWHKYGTVPNGNQAATAAATQANAQATAQAQQDQATFADLALLGAGSSVGFGGGVSTTSVQPYEAPADNFAQEVASILQAAGVSPGNANQPAAPANSSAPPATQVTAPHVVHRVTGTNFLFATSTPEGVLQQ